MKGFFRKLVSLTAVGLLSSGITLAKEDDSAKAFDGKKVAIVYFSHDGETYSPNGKPYKKVKNTEIVAKKIQENIKDAKVFELKVSEKYPENYDKMIEYAQKQQSEGKLPELKDSPDVSKYDVIFVGTPVWWGKMSLPVEAFLKSEACKGKIVIPFITHEGSGESGIGQEMKNISGCKKVLKSLVIKGSEANKEETDKLIKDFLNEIEKHTLN